MKIPQVAAESHRSMHIGWLRAAVLGANNGIVSNSSLIVGVAADLAREKVELTSNVEYERTELTQIYVERGLDPTLAWKGAGRIAFWGVLAMAIMAGIGTLFGAVV